MREIKLRAWDKLNKEMINIESINFQERRVYRNDVSYLNFNDTELMEYTGLKDMKEKEIYEGDIVTLHNDKYKVIFNTGEARYVLREDEFEMEIPFTNNNNRRMEIIGNIYENPELLGDKNDF